MIDLYYTGSGKPNQEQIEPTLSLGGFVSSSLVPNDFFSNLFGEITNNSISKNVREHICLALIAKHNIEDIDFTIATTKNGIAEFFIGALLFNEKCNSVVTQKLQNQFTAPRGIQLLNCTSVYGESKIIIENSIIDDEIEIFVDGQSVGIIYMPEEFTVFDSNFEIITRFNFEKKFKEFFLIQKDLDNFEIDVTAVSTKGSTITIENTLPVVNKLSLGNLTSEQTMAIFIARGIKSEVLKKYKKKGGDCSELFDLHNAGEEVETIEIVNLEIDYELEPAGSP